MIIMNHNLELPKLEAQLIFRIVIPKDIKQDLDR